MGTRTVSVTLKANVADFKAQMKQAGSSLEDVVKSADKTGEVAETRMGRMAQSAQLQTEAWTTTGNALLGFGAVGAAAFGGIVKTTSDFETQMSAVQAATLSSTGEMELLSDAAKQAGADTAFSATEAAQGIEELAKAGVSTTDILNGGLAGALDLAAAGGISVQEASESAASALTQFGLSGEDVPHVADLLAAAAGKAQGGVTEMSQALSQAGLVASNSGLSIEETTGTLAAFASAGLLGSDAGTSFKSMLQRLQNPSKESAELMKELGISLYDANGNMVGMSALAGQLQDKLGGMTQAQRDATLAQLFGSDAVRAATVLYQEGADGIDGWIDAVDQAGYASETAAARQDNLAGSWESFTGSLETLAITVGQNVTPVLKKMLDAGAEVVDWVAGLPAPVLNGAAALGGFVSVGALVGGAFLTLTPKVMGLYNGFKALKGLKLASVSSGMSGIGRAASLMTSPMTIAAGAAVLLGGAIMSNMQDSRRQAALLEEYAAAYQLVGDAAQDAAKEVTTSHLGDAMQGFKSPISSGEFSSIREQLDEMGISQQTWTDAIMGSKDAMDQVQKAAMEHGGEAGMAMVLQTAELAASNKDAADAAKEYQAAVEAGEGTGEALAGVLGNTADGFSDVADEAAEAQEEIYGYLDAQREASGAALSMSDALIGYQDALDKASDAIEENGRTLDITTEAGRNNQAALDDIASSGWDVIDSMIEQGKSNKELGKSMESTRQDFIDTALQMGLTEQAANDLADEYGLIPDDINTQANLDRAKASADAQGLKGQYDAVPKAVNSVAKLFGGGSVKAAAADIGGALNGIPRSVHTTVSISTVGKQVALNAIQAVKNAAAGNASGGYIQGHAGGGHIAGMGTGTSDSLIRRLSNGEYVINALATRKNRQLLDAINYQGLDAQALFGLAGGGAVSGQEAHPASTISVAAPQTLKIVDADGALVGRMRVEASNEAERWVNA